MLLLTFAILLLLTVGGYYLSRDLFSPFVLQPGVWSFILLVFQLLPHGFYPLTHDFLPALLLWNMGFLLTAYVIFYYTRPSSLFSQEREPSSLLLNIYFGASVVFMPIVIGLTVWIAYVEDPVNMFRYLRIMNTGVDEDIEAPDLGVLYYLVSMTYVLLFFMLLYVKRKWMIAVVLVLNLLFAFVTMAKTVFLSVIFPFLYIAYRNGKIKIRHFLYGLVGFVVLSFVLQSFRSASSQDNVEAVEATPFISLYLLSSMPAFDTYAESASAREWGSHTFRLFYAIGHALGITEEPEKTILPFVGVPELTNTYTVLYPFYIDFGLLGVFFFSLCYGCAYGFLYKKVVTGGKMAEVLYAIALCFLILEFIGEFFFTNLSQEIQHVFFVVLPFLFAKRRKDV